MNLALTPAQDCLARHRVRVFGDGRHTLVFGPGFGCQQAVWEPVALELAREHRVVLFDFHTDHVLPNDPQAPQYASDALLASPISFIKVANGVYENRCNLAEAQVIAGTVRELLNREIGLSIGIVAFSEAQQTEIETALETLAAQDQQFATLLEREYLREDNGQFNGLFVKNLENVQGDERDIILLSICYAPGPSGKMLMNFGPINQRGAW